MAKSYHICGDTLIVDSFADKLDYWTSEALRDDIRHLELKDGIRKIPAGSFNSQEILPL